MNRSTTLLFLLLTFLCTNCVIAAEKIPAKLQGLWLIDKTSKGNWDGITIVENHVEYYYDLFQLDSISNQADKYQLWLSSKSHGKLSLTIEIKADSTAAFQFSKWDAPRICKLSAKHPDMVYYQPAELQNRLKGPWINPNNFSNELSVKNNKVVIDQKSWDIVWSGEYLKKEYRALLKHEDDYRLAYFTKTGTNLKLNGDGLASAYQLKAKNPAVYQLLGNWYEPKANKWTFGFFENFAIYNGGFWKYDALSITGNTGKITLKNGNKKHTLILTKKADSSLTIKMDNIPQQVYKRAKKTLPPYSTEDKTAFKDTHFQKADTAYITGYLRNLPNQNPFSVSYEDIIKEDQKSVYGEIDSLGRFLVKVPLLNTTQVYMDWGRITKTDAIEPGEHYFLYYDFATQQYLIMGDNARFHNEISTYSIFDASPYNEEEHKANQKKKGLDFLNAKKAEFNKANAYSERHFKQNPHLSAKSKYFIKNYNRYQLGFDLMQKRFDLNRQTNERFPEEYMAFVKDSLYANPVTPFTLIREFSSFSRDYLSYMKDRLPGSSVSHSEVLYNLIQNGGIQASDEERKSAQLTWQIDSIRGIDTLRSKQLATTMTEKQQSLVSNLITTHKEKIAEAVNRMLWSRVLKSETAFYEKNISNEDIRKSYLTKTVYNYFEQTRHAMEGKEFNAYLKKINSVPFQASLVEYQIHLLKVPKMDFAYAQSLKNTDHLKSSKDADSLFKALLAPYKGKVVYIDFWGTWCGPCKAEMKHVGTAKEALKDKDVVFMYFANNSPELVWKTIIKEMNLTGPNVVHYRLPDEQQSLIERRLSIKGFPTYMLVDKEGNMVSTEAPRPSNPDRLVQEVNELLK